MENLEAEPSESLIDVATKRIRAFADVWNVVKNRTR